MEINNISDMKAYNSFQKYINYIIRDYINDISDDDIHNFKNIANPNKFFYSKFIKPIDNVKINFKEDDNLRLVFTKKGLKHFKFLLDDIIDILIKKDYVLKITDIEYNNYRYYNNLCKLSKKDKLNLDRNELNTAYRVIYNVSCKN